MEREKLIHKIQNFRNIRKIHGSISHILVGDQGSRRSPRVTQEKSASKKPQRHHRHSPRTTENTTPHTTAGGGYENPSGLRSHQHRERYHNKLPQAVGQWLPPMMMYLCIYCPQLLQQQDLTKNKIKKNKKRKNFHSIKTERKVMKNVIYIDIYKHTGLWNNKPLD